MGETLEQSLREVLNCHSAENASGTPDFLLARYLTACLNTYNDAIKARADWYGLPIKRPGMDAVGA